MVLKATAAFLFALVLQWAQVCQVVASQPDCGQFESSQCDCCAGPDSCPCMENGEPVQKPAPLVPASGNVLKLPAAKAEETRVSVECLPMLCPSTGTTAPLIAGLPAGYCGVRLSVAFCSFVI